MKKKIVVISMAAMMSIAAAMTSFAGWSKLGANWRYFNEDGSQIMDTWYQDTDGRWYHFNARGDATRGWFEDTDKKWYYFDRKDAFMLTDAHTPDGYYVGADGVYVPDKVREIKEMGPAGQLDYSDEGKLKVRNMTLETLSAFATANLTTTTWGDDTSADSIAQINAWINNELKTKGITDGDTTPITITEESVEYRVGDKEPELRLVKVEDRYELTDYANVDDDCIETALMGMCMLISYKPQELYNQIYQCLQVNQRYVKDYEYTKYGDFQIMYRMDGEYPTFLIKAK